MKKIIILIFFITSLFSSDINDKGICKYVINKSLLNNQISFTKQEKACVSVVLVSLYNRYLPKKVGNLKILQFLYILSKFKKFLISAPLQLYID